MSARLIIQFGTSRFLQAHAALFLHEAREQGQAAGPIVVVQTSGAAGRAGRVAAFGRPEGYPVIIRGMQDGVAVDRQVQVTSVARGLSAAADWDELRRLFVADAGYVISNTGDAGYAVAAADRGRALLQDDVPASFPGKLTALLHHRWRHGAAPITVLPCELLNRNGAVLQGLVAELAQQAGAEAGFVAWLQETVIWADTLVDRIVSAPLEPVGAVAEPYALWAVERRPGLVLPFEHPSLELADSLEPFERLKLHILNLGHTVLAEIFQRDGLAAGTTVKDMLADPAIAARLDALYAEEVLPGFAAHGMEDGARAYVATTLDRFRNPFLEHRVADIAQNHALKVERRIAAFIDWAAERDAALPMPVLRGLVARHAAREQA
ncbi:D-mannonate oxidoreductase [Pseudoroseomonas deserti]|uniref:D-mannonate oxidoreductase n=1 Tax=Teichococcus deserti TaxID=1817963 RepID=A0A1V2H140_9PROT|nr:D-mannonate oxidoreductase [Pseudoroseomonas deserti]ONG51773.1 D-mannonate oxidoreductase [Pseudoroseomonas deserti]